MENRSHAFLAGLFLLILGASALGALWWFSGRSEETHSYIVETRGNVTGLNLQGQVRYRGIRVGKVESIRLDPRDARITLIGISVRTDVPITKGTTAELGHQGLTGIAHVLLKDDGGNAELLAPNEEGSVRIVMQDSLMQELADTGGDALRQARDLLASMNEILRPENRQAITKMLANLESTTAQARETSARLQQLLSPENMRRIEATLAHTERTTAQIEPLVADVRGLVGRLQAVSDKVDVALGDSQTSGIGTIAPRVGELTAELSSTSRQLSRVLRMLENSPESLIFGRQRVGPGPGEAGFAAPAGNQEKQ